MQSHMQLYFLLLRKELREIASNKKVLLYGIIGLVLPAFANAITTSPVIPVDIVFLMLSIVCSCFAGEIVFFEMASEYEQKTIDILVISPVNTATIILSKITLPSLITISATILGMLINDNLARYMELSSFFKDSLNLKSLFAVFCSTPLFSIIDFMLICKNNGDKKLKSQTFIVVLFSAIMTAVFVCTRDKYLFLPLIFSICVFILLLFLSIKLMRTNKNQTPRPSIIAKPNLLILKHASPAKVILIKCLYDISSWISFAFRWILLTVVQLVAFRYSPLFGSISIFFPFLLIIGEILYNNYTSDKISHTEDILKASLKKRGSIIIGKCLLPFGLLQVNIIIALALSESLFCAAVRVASLEIYLLLCFIITWVVSSKVVHTLRDYRICKAIIACACLVLFISTLFFQYFLASL